MFSIKKGEQKMIHGSCLCKKVKFEISRKPNSLSHCHCSRCRKSTGHQAAFLIGNIRDFSMTEGVDCLTHYKPEVPWTLTRSFCKHCGSAIGGAEPDAGIYVVPVSALDDDPGVKPIVHIHVDSKPDWYDIHDDIRQFAGDYIAG